MASLCIQLNRGWNERKREIGICILAFIEKKLNIRLECTITRLAQTYFFVLNNLDENTICRIETILKPDVGRGIIDRMQVRDFVLYRNCIDLEYPSNSKSIKDTLFAIVRMWFLTFLDMKSVQLYSASVSEFTNTVQSMNLNSILPID